MGFNAAAQAVDNGIKPGEWLFSESNYIYTRISATVENDTTIAGTSPDVSLSKSGVVGIPVLKDTTWRLATAGEVASADPIGDGGTEEWGFIVSSEIALELAADDISAIEVAIITRGPAIINSDLIPATDPYGTAIVAADYISLASKLGIASKPSPVTTTVQVNQ